MFSTKAVYNQNNSQRINMDEGVDGSDADGEWSDGSDADKTDDADETLSSAGCSDHTLEGTASLTACRTASHTASPLRAPVLPPDQHSRPPSHCAWTNTQLCAGPDIILDRIDAEWRHLTSVQSLVPIKRLSSKQRYMLRRQGVEFDTADDTSAMETRHPPVKDGVSRLGAPPVEGVKDVEKDSGVHEESSLVGGAMTERIIGQVQMCSQSEDGDDELFVRVAHRHLKGTRHKQNSLSDDKCRAVSSLRLGATELDSDRAKHLDESYKLILNHKWRLAEHRKNNSDMQKKVARISCDESLNPEDLNKAQFGQLISPVRKVVEKDVNSSTDGDSVQTEDFEIEYQKSLVKQAVQYAESLVPSEQACCPVVKTRRKTASDMESVKTEDFEQQFRTILVKHIAAVPITGFDHLMVDSDIDTVKSHDVRQKFRMAINESSAKISSSEEEEDEEENEDDDAASVAFSKKCLDILKKLHQTKECESRQQPCALSYGVDSNGTNSQDSELDRRLVQLLSPVKEKVAKRKALHRQRPSTLTCTAGDLEDAERRLGRREFEMKEELDIERSKAAWRALFTPRKAAKKIQKASKPLKPIKPPAAKAKVNVEMSLEGLRLEYAKLHNEMQTAKKENQRLQLELRGVNETLQEKKREMKGAEIHLKDKRSRAEDARTELMLTEFKRDSAQKELGRIGDELRGKQQQLERLQRPPKVKVTGPPEVTASPSGPHEKEALVKQQLESSQNETLSRRIECLQAEREDLLRQRETLRESASRELKAVQQQLESREGKWEGERQGLEERLETHRAAAAADTAQLTRQLDAMTSQLAAQRDDAHGREHANSLLRDRLSSLERDSHGEKQLWQQQRDELETKLHALKGHKHEMEQARSAWQTDKQQALESLEQQLVEQRRQTEQTEQTEQALKQRLSELQGRLTAKDLEVEVLRDHLKQHDITSQEQVQKMRKDAQEQLQVALTEERERCGAQLSAAVQRETMRCRAESQCEVSEAQQELRSERQLLERHQHQVAALRKELEEARQQGRQAERDRLSAASQLEQTAGLERERELDLVRETVEKEVHRTVETLQQRLRVQEEEITHLASARDAAQLTDCSLDREHDALARQAMDECRKMSDLLPPGAATSARYNLWSPRHGGSFRRSLSSRYELSLSMALSNMRLCNEEVRQYLHDLQREVTQKTDAVAALDRDRKEEVDRLKDRMHAEKLEAMEKLKDMLIKEHLEEVDRLHRSLGKGKGAHRSLRQKDRELQQIQCSMAAWKERTADKLASKFQEEMARELDKRISESQKIGREWEREKEQLQNEIDRLRRQSHKASMTGYPAPMRAYAGAATLDESATRQVRQLQSRMTKLQVENTNLKRAQLSCSVPDLSSILLTNSFSQALTRSPARSPALTPDRQLRELESRVSEAESRASLADQRSEVHQLALNQRAYDVSKLQNSLTQQTKELMQLERAYSKLQGMVPPAEDKDNFSTLVAERGHLNKWKSQQRFANS